MDILKKGVRLKPYLLFMVSAIILCIRAQYGYQFNDEPFIVTLAQRFSYGDSLIIDEWNFAQNFGTILLPFFKLYILINGSTEGVLLFLRFTYCILWAATSLIVYTVFRQKYSCTFVVYLYLLLFSPLDQMTMSYTSVGLMSCLLIGTVFFYHLEIKALKLPVFVGFLSILLVIATLSNPYLAVIYIGFIIFVVIFHRIKRSKASLYFCKVALFSVPIVLALVAIYLYCFIFSKHSVGEFIEKLPYMFKRSSLSETAPNKPILYFAMIVKSWPLHGLLTLSSLALLAVPHIRGSVEKKTMVFGINALYLIFKTVYFAAKNNEPLYNQQVVPVVFLGLLAFFMLEDPKKHTVLLCSFGIWGAVYSFFSHYASDTGIMAISMGLTLCGVAGILFIGMLWKELIQYYKSKYADDGTNAVSNKQKTVVKALSAMFVLVFVCQISSQAYLKTCRHYMDSSLTKMDSTIGIGVSKGIKTTYKNKESYETRTENIRLLLENVDIEKQDSIKFLSLLFDPTVYLNAELPYGTYSAWNFANDEVFANKSNLYYSVNPENIPNVIICYKSDNRITMIDLDLTHYTEFTAGNYKLLVSPDLVK